MRLTAIVLVLSTVVGVTCAKLNMSSRLQVSAAATNVLVDYPGPSLVERRATTAHVANLQARAELYGRLLVTEPVLDRVAARAGIPRGQIAGVARTTASVPIPLREPGSEVRANQIRDARLPYHLEMQARTEDPILAIYAEAPTTVEAEKLANAAVLGLQDYLHALAVKERAPAAQEPRLRQLGSARGGVVGSRAKVMAALLTFMVGFVITCALMLTAVRLLRRRTWPAYGRAQEWEPDDEPSDDWPHTTRLLPWAIAGFITLIWMSPFDKIELAISTPIDMKLDRLVLPLVIGVWLLAFAAGGKVAPRLRLTPVHIALGLFLTVAFLSVVLNAGELSQSLEFDLSFKKLPLLVTYLSLFVIVSSSVRPREVRAFLTYTLVLSMIVAVGIIWELRFKVNVFNLVWGKILPSFFTLDADANSTLALDSLGRRGIVGPADVGLEAVSMLALALPIALVGLIGAERRKQRLFYGFALCILIAGMFATGRKSALIAPAAVILTIAYFRRRELLSLAPLGLVVVVMVTVLSPGAVHGVISQFTRPDHASVSTTSDRTSDYDAIRPDLWSHLLFGRGYGSYTPDTYRILDSDILSRIVDTGLLGLIAYLAFTLSVVFASRKIIARRDPRSTPIALVATAAAVCFIVVATLYDVSGFPHATYVFLYIAGLGTVVMRRAGGAGRHVAVGHDKVAEDWVRAGPAPELVGEPAGISDGASPRRPGTLV